MAVVVCGLVVVFTVFVFLVDFSVAMFGIAFVTHFDIVVVKVVVVVVMFLLLVLFMPLISALMFLRMRLLLL